MYADLLQEHGDDDRAEFIRLQVALAAGGDGLPDREELEAQAARLLDRHRPEWEAGVRGDGVMEVTFCRGFVDGVTATADAFVRAGGGWWRAHPVRRVRLERIDGGLARVAAAPHLDSVRELHLADEFTGGQLGALAGTPRPGGAGHFPYLESLSVGGWTATDDFFWDGAAALAACRLPRLRELHLLDMREGDAAAEAVAGAPWFADRGLGAVLASPLRKKLSEFRVGYGRVTARGLHAVARAAAEPPLRHLSLVANYDWWGDRRREPDWSLDPDRLGAVLARHPALQIDLRRCPIPPAIQTVVQDRFGGRVCVGSE
jgi:hypothetical protein